MVNQSIIYDEWLIKDFLRAFMIHAESGVTMKRSDGDVAALAPLPSLESGPTSTWGEPSSPSPSLPRPSHLLAIVVIFFSFFFFW